MQQAELPPDAFAHSLGVNRGKPVTVVVTFSPRIASYVLEREWHKSQRVEATDDGGVRMTLKVCPDAALRTWVLGFGGLAKVETPSSLAEEILTQLEEAREAYAPPLDIALPQRVFRFAQPALPGTRPVRAS